MLVQSDYNESRVSSKKSVSSLPKLWEVSAHKLIKSFTPSEKNDSAFQSHSKVLYNSIPAAQCSSIS